MPLPDPRLVGRETPYPPLPLSLPPSVRLDYRLKLWAPTSASRAVSAVAKLLVKCSSSNLIIKTVTSVRQY